MQTTDVVFGFAILWSHCRNSVNNSVANVVSHIYSRDIGTHRVRLLCFSLSLFGLSSWKLFTHYLSTVAKSIGVIWTKQRAVAEKKLFIQCSTEPNVNTVYVCVRRCHLCLVWRFDNVCNGCDGGLSINKLHKLSECKDWQSDIKSTYLWNCQWNDKQPLQQPVPVLFFPSE